MQKKSIAIDLSAGPYYYKGYRHKHAIGGQGAISLRIREYVSVDILGSYDNLFHGRIQATVSLSIPLGPKTGRKQPPYFVPSFATTNSPMVLSEMKL